MNFDLCFIAAYFIILVFEYNFNLGSKS